MTLHPRMTLAVILSATLALALPAAAKIDEAPRPVAPVDPATDVAAPTGNLIMADDGEAIAAFLRDSGYRAEIEFLSDGRPSIASAAEGLRFWIFLRDCVDGRDCENIQFHAGFTMETPPTIERIGEWNSRRIVGQAFLDDEGQPRIGHFVTMRGGLSRPAFADAFDFFREALRDFAVHIGFRR